jgi:hypothetical protein
MTLVRPTADLSSFPAPGWTTAPLFSKVNSEDPDDATFLTALAPGAEDPQVALQIADLEIPYGSSGRIEVRVRMRWNEVLTELPTFVRIGLADAADLGVTDPTLLFERSLLGTNIVSLSALDFETYEVAFDFDDFAGLASAMGVYVEMTPNAADATAVGHISWIEVLACVSAVQVEGCSLGSLTAGEVINNARDHHTSFDARKHPNATLLRLLSSYQRDITAKIVQVNGALCASDILVTLPLDDFSAGVTLPSFVYMMPNVTLRTLAGTIEPIDLVNATFRSEFEMDRKFAYLRGNKLFLGRIEENYTSYNQLQLQLVLTPPNLVALTDPLVLPDYGVDAYVGHLVMKMALRDGLEGSLLNQAGTLETAFLNAVAQQKGAEASHTLDAWPGGF